MAALATVADLEARLGRTLTGDEANRAEALLDDVSAVVRSYTGQQFEAGTSTVRVRSRRGRLRLPQSPVTALTTVADMAGSSLDVTSWYGGNVLVLPDGWYDVTYNHGYAAVPDDVKAVVCNMAGRAFGQPADTTGLQSESVGGYSYSVGVAAAAGAAGMLNDERAVLDRYRRVGGFAVTGP